MRAVDCGRSKSVKARRAYVCFLEREVYAFFDERVRGAMLRARIFCLWRAAEGDVRGGRWTGRGWIAGGAHEELVGRATQEERHVKVRERREEGYFSFSWGKIGE